MMSAINQGVSIVLQKMRVFLFTVLLVFICNPAAADSRAENVLQGWYGLVLELVRHTPTYSPPIASRSFAYLGVTGFEALASGSSDMISFSGQLNDLTALPQRETDEVYDDAVVLHVALGLAVQNYFSNTGPTGQRAIKAALKKFGTEANAGVAPDVQRRSEAYAAVLVEAILKWSNADGATTIENMGFPLTYKLGEGKAHWLPTSQIRQQQVPLLPAWGSQRSFAMANGKACPLPPPPAYSEDPASDFFKEALEVVAIKKDMTPEQQNIARFWSDDPMLSSTPPGHWLSIALQIFVRDRIDLKKQIDVLARLGIAEADAFIGCWQVKYQYDLLRPVTYIKRVIDPKWESLLITPPFPEYPSGHSTQSAAAAVVLTQIFGENFSFEDATHVKDGFSPRRYANFWAAAEEAAISRLYGGIHFRSGVMQGLEQGRCIGNFTANLKTRR